MYKAEFNLNGKNIKITKDKLLTIGIITKNECEKLERCLKSLMPIKEALDCEIIVTDTGSTDNTVEISKKYADKVIKFDWIDDFSAARNTGIEASKGLWFMWIDSDEWVDDPKPIIDFFKGGDYKKYASATIEMLDFEAGDNNNIGVTLARMLLLSKNIKFEGAIHENIPMMGPRKSINATVFHDGYSFENADKKREKHNRNLDLLLKMYNDNPQDLRTIRYVVDQYRFMDEFEKSNKLCDRGIELIEKNVDRNDADKAYELHFNIMKSANYLSMNKLQECIDILNALEGIDSKNSRRFLDIYFMLSEAYFRLGQISKSSKFAKKYVEIYINRANMDSIYSTTFYETSNKTDVVKKMFLLSIEDTELNRDDDSLISYIENFRVARKDNNMPQSDEEYISDLFDIINSSKKHELLIYGYGQVKQKRINFEINKFKELIFEYMVLNREELYSIAKEIFKIQEDRELYLLSKFIISDIDNNFKTAKETIIDILSLKPSNKYVQNEMLYGVFKYDMDFENISALIDVFSIKNILELRTRIDDRLIDYVLDYNINHKELRNKIRYKAIVINAFNEYVENSKVEKEQLIKIYKIYVEFLPDIINFMYGKSISEEKIDFYPPIHRFGYFLSRANELKEQKDFVGYIKELKKSLVHYPNMERAIKREVDVIEKDLNKENERKNEFEELAIKIKQKIYELITLGECDEALSVVSQLQSIMPNDKELKELKSRLTSF